MVKNQCTQLFTHIWRIDYWIHSFPNEYFAHSAWAVEYTDSFSAEE